MCNDIPACFVNINTDYLFCYFLQVKEDSREEEESGEGEGKNSGKVEGRGSECRARAKLIGGRSWWRFIVLVEVHDSSMIQCSVS